MLRREHPEYVTCKFCNVYKNDGNSDKCYHEAYLEDFPNGLPLEDLSICALYIPEVLSHVKD